jgi:glycosyltransferase involved in cell wall biosynthesis
MKVNLYTVGRSHLSDLSNGLFDNEILNKLITFWPKFKFNIPKEFVKSYFCHYFPVFFYNNISWRTYFFNRVINRLIIKDNSIIDVNIALNVDISSNSNIIIDSPICSPFFQLENWNFEQDFTSIKISRLESLSNNFNSENFYKAFNNARKIVVPSNHAKSTYFHDLHHKISVVPFWIPGNYTISNIADSKSYNNLCFIGVVCPSKGIHYLILALNKLGYNGTLHLFGNIDNQKYIDYLNKIKSFNSYKLKFYGHLPQVELYKYLSKMDLNIMPSVSEGLPLSALQALSLGVKTIASKSSSLSDVLGTNFVYDTRDTDDFCNLLDSVFTNRVEYKLEFTNCFSFDQYVSSWINILNQNVYE